MDTATKEEVLQANHLNPKRFEYGQVVYYIGTDRNTGRQIVCWGTVIEHYAGEIAIQKYDSADCRTVHSDYNKELGGYTPVSQMPSVTKWMKLPKKWSWDTKLFKIDHTNIPAGFDKYKGGFPSPLMVRYAADAGTLSPEQILEAIQDGVLVRWDQIDHCELESEVTKVGWRIRKVYRDMRSGHISVPHYQVYDTLEEAKAVVDAYDAELERQSNLSDKDWSIEEINRTVDRWAQIYTIPEDEREAVRERILSLDNIEDVETRVANGGIEWKYWKNKRWLQVQAE